MEPQSLIVFCFKCGNSFKVEDTLKLNVVSGFEELGEAKNLHICQSCYEALPKTDEIGEPELSPPIPLLKLTNSNTKNEINLPINPSKIDILKLPAIYSKEQLNEYQMLPLIEKELEQLETAINQALPILQPYGVTKEHLEQLIDKIIAKNL